MSQRQSPSLKRVDPTAGAAPRPRPVRRRRAAASALPLVLLFAVALLPRVVVALKPGLWVDEIFSLAMATGHSLEHPAADADPALGDYREPERAAPPSRFRAYAEHESPPAGPERVVRAVFLSDTSPPLYYLLLAGWTRVLGTGDAALRLFSAFWALASLPLVWWIGRRVGGRRTAWIATALFALSPPAVYYSGEGRMYSLLWFLGLALAWSTLELARRGPALHRLVPWCGAAAAGLLSHYFFVFVWLACVFWLLLRAGRLTRARLAAAMVAVALVIAPWYLRVPDSLARWRVTAGWLDFPLSWREAAVAPAWLGWNLLSGSGMWGGSPWGGVAVAALLAAAGVAMLRREGPRSPFRDGRLLLWLWTAGAVLGPLAFDLLRGTNASLVPRYALAGLPAVLLLAGMLLGRLRPRTSALAVLVVLLAWAPALRDIVVLPARPWQPFPAVARRIERSPHRPELVVVHSIPSGVVGVARYLDAEVPVLSWVPQLGQRDTAAMADLVGERCRVALVKVHDLGISSPAEAWLGDHATLLGTDRPHPSTTVQHFRLCPEPAP